MKRSFRRTRAHASSCSRDWSWPLGFVSVAVLLMACSAEHPASEEQLGQASQAIHEDEVSPSFALSVALPAALDIQGMGVAASRAVHLADRVQMLTKVVSTGATTSGGLVEVGTDAKIGTIVSYGPVRLGDRTKVFGDVTAGGLISPGSDVSISGTSAQSVVFGAPVQWTWNVTVPGPNLGALEVAPDSRKDIPPGRYGAGKVYSRGKLTLHSGTYYFDSLTVEPQAQLLIDDSAGPVQVYLGNSFTYRGEIHPAAFGIPKFLVGVRGTAGVMIEAPFTGVVVAPASDIRLQAARPEGHRGTFVGKDIYFEPDTIVNTYDFPWAALVGGRVNPDVSDSDPHRMRLSEVDKHLVSNLDGTGSLTITANPGLPVAFTLPDSYTVEGGLIANGKVQTTYTTTAGSTVSCTYQGQSSSASPSTGEDLIKGRILKFEACTDGKPAAEMREGVSFTTTLIPAQDVPVTIGTPMREVGACHETVEIVSALETYEMRKNFKWSDVKPVQEVNTGGDPTLYYAWIYIKNKKEHLALKQLGIHELKRPLFTSELDAMAGKCGSFVNPGDGEGYLVPVVIPGKTYNKIKEVQSRNDITDDKVLFEAVILRDVPAEARNPNGSIRLEVLKNAHFVYLPYEKRPLPAWDSITLDMGGGVSKVLYGAIQWVAQEVKDTVETVTNVLGYIDKWLRGTTTVNLQISSITRDPAFTLEGDPLRGSPYPVMIRGWGEAGGQKLGAPGLQVSVLQKFLGSIVPETSMGRTGDSGNVSIDAVEGGSTRGDTGLCVELANESAKVIGDSIFFLPYEVCDFRAFDASGKAKVPGDFRLAIKSEAQAIHIENTMLLGLYQADDVFRYARKVVGYTPSKTAQIMTGYWAETLNSSDGGPDGFKRVYTPCFNYGGILADHILGVAIAIGSLAGIIAPPLGVIGGLVGMDIGLHYSNADIIMPLHSVLPHKRTTMSHEMGHYMFCSMLEERWSRGPEWVSLGALTSNGDLSDPLMYTNEAVAEYFTGQVAGAAQYDWARLKAHFNYVPNSTSIRNYSNFCSPQVKGSASDAQPISDTVPTCWESNITEVATDKQDSSSIGRIATMLMDAADDPNTTRGTNRVERGSAWQWTRQLFAGPDWPLTYSDKDYLASDFENVAIGGGGIRAFVNKVADNMAHDADVLDNIAQLMGDMSLKNVKGALQSMLMANTIIETNRPINDEIIYRALNDTMRARGNHNWCERCAVLATHDPAGAGVTGWSETLFGACRDNAFLSKALNEAPPEPNLNLLADDCKPCPSGKVHNADYSQCDDCAMGVVVSGKCEVCGVDKTIDLATAAPGESFTIQSNGAQDPNDNCPNIYWVELQNVTNMFTAHNDIPTLIAKPVWPTNETSCTGPHIWFTAMPSGPAAAFVYAQETVNGTWVGGGSLDPCSGVPEKETLRSNAPYPTMRFGVPAGGPDNLKIIVGVDPGTPF